MEVKKSILSIAELIAEILEEDKTVAKMAKMSYPIIAPEKAVCPYVVYRLANLYPRQTKDGPADTAEIEVMCCGANVEQMIKLSEAVREALDGIQSVSNDGQLRMRACYLSGATEGWEAQTFYRTLKFIARV